MNNIEKLEELRNRKLLEIKELREELEEMESALSGEWTEPKNWYHPRGFFYELECVSIIPKRSFDTSKKEIIFGVKPSELKKHSNCLARPIEKYRIEILPE